MAYDLNFWGEPDWARESGISPLFLMAVVVCLFGLAGAASASWAYHVRLSRQSELGELTRRCEKIAPEALAAKDHRRKAALWDKALMGLDERARAGMPWSAYLEELRRQVPDDIRFDTLAIRMEQTVERGEASGRATSDRLAAKYVMTINGRARGDDPQRTITRFVQSLGSSSLAAAGEPRLNFISGIEAAAAEKTFAVVCTFQVPDVGRPAQEAPRGR